MLTQQQEKLFKFLVSYFSKKNIMPNFDEMKNALNLQLSLDFSGGATKLAKGGFLE